MTSFGTYTSANSGAAGAATQAVTIPASVSAGDAMLLVCLSESNSAVHRTHSVAYTGTGTWTRIGTQPARIGGTSWQMDASAWTCSAQAGDAGKVITLTVTGGNESLGVALVTYPGAAVSFVDVSNVAATTPQGLNLTVPAATTVAGGDWAVALVAANNGTSGQGTVTAGTSGLTVRGNTTGGWGENMAAADSAGSVGVSGTGIGGGTLAISKASTAYVWIVGISPLGTAHTGTADLSGSGTLTATGVFAGSAALSGSGSMSWSGLRVFKATTLSGSGTLTGTKIGTISSFANLSGRGSMTATGVAALFGGAVLSGSGSLFVGGVQLGFSAALSGSGTLAIIGRGGVKQASAGVAAPYAYPGTSQVSVAPPGTQSWQYLSTLGIVTALTYSFACPGGADKMSATVMIPASFRTQLLWPGWQVRVTRGGHVVWSGKLDEPVPSAQGWTVTAVGDGNRGQDFRGVYSGAWGAGTPDDAVNQAITRGLPWANTGIGTPAGMWLGQAQDSGSMTVADLLNLVCTRGGLTWYADSQPDGAPADLAVFPLPVAVSRLLVVTDPVARTLGGDINTIIMRYQSGGAGGTSPASFAVTTVQNAKSVAAHGVIETYVDLSSAGTMSAAQAQTVGNYVLAIYQRASFAGPFTISYGHLLNTGGSPVDPGTDQAGTVCRLILTDYGYGGEVSPAPITFIVGAYEWDDFAQKATVTPYGTLNQSLSGLLGLENTLLTPVTVSG